MTPTNISDDDILAAARRASDAGKRSFHNNDLYIELGFIPGKGPSWNGRHEVLSWSRVSKLLLAHGYQKSPQNKRKWCYRETRVSNTNVSALYGGLTTVKDDDPSSGAKDIAYFVFVAESWLRGRVIFKKITTDGDEIRELIRAFQADTECHSIKITEYWNPRHIHTISYGIQEITRSYGTWEITDKPHLKTTKEWTSYDSWYKFRPYGKPSDMDNIETIWTEMDEKPHDPKFKQSSTEV
jgi:hypothetical protein